MARLDYEARRAARIDRLHARAEKARTESASAEQQARRMADVIPLGQPILVGHHSEGRERSTAMSGSSRPTTASSFSSLASPTRPYAPH
jgi:hypothetical protein